MWITEKEKPSYLGSNWENLNMDSTLDDTESMLNFLDVTESWSYTGACLGSQEIYVNSF